MRGFTSKFTLLSVVLSSLIMFGCSSSDDGGAVTTTPTYTGVTTPAAITSANAEEMGRGATEGVNESVKIATIGEGLPIAVDINTSNSALMHKIEGIARDIIESQGAQNLPVSLVITADELNQQIGDTLYCGGSVTVPDNFDPNDYWNFVMTFNNLCYDDGTTALTMNGTITFAETDAEFSISFTNFSANIAGTVETFSATVSCTTDITPVCTISTEFTGSDGNVYKLTNMEVNGDSSGYTVTATFYHYSLGYATITTTTPVTYGNCGIHPDNGQIFVSSSSTFVYVTFNSNCSFTLEGNDGTADFGPTIIDW